MKFSRKNFENWRFWKISFFSVGHFENLFSKKKFFFLLHSHVKWPKFLGLQGWVKILIKSNVTTLFDPCQTFWRGVYFLTNISYDFFNWQTEKKNFFMKNSCTKFGKQIGKNIWWISLLITNFYNIVCWTYLGRIVILLVAIGQVWTCLNYRRIKRTSASRWLCIIWRLLHRG